MYLPVAVAWPKEMILGGERKAQAPKIILKGKMPVMRE
jgi:hypothetical protein